MPFPILKAPFPYFGGKSRVAAEVWERFGPVTNYVEPFAGSLAVLLGRPFEIATETVNDIDCFLANFWRALAADPEALAAHADWPVNEADLHARHLWLVNQLEFRESMKTDPGFYDARVAGWWVWGISQWIGSGWCSHPEWTGRTNAGRHGRGIQSLERRWRQKPELTGEGKGIHQGTLPARQIPRLSADQGINRAELGSSRHQGFNRKIPSLGDEGRGVHRDSIQVTEKRPLLSGNGHGAGIHSDRGNDLFDYFDALAARLRRVRVCCGDWSRVLGPSVTIKHGITGVFLDPPYDMRVVSNAGSGRDGAAPSDGLYSCHDNDVSAQVRAWAIENGGNPQLRIALCGYEDEHAGMPADWECFAWKAPGGFGSQRADGDYTNNTRERVWFSPACLRGAQPTLF